MATAKNKTQATKASVSAYLAGIKDPVQRKDSKTLSKLLQEVTRQKPVMWGSAIVGFGSVHYKYESGREGDTPLLGFSARKGALVIYGIGKARDDAKLMAALGEHTTGKGCLYLKRLDEVKLPVLKKLLQRAVKAAKAA